MVHRFRAIIKSNFIRQLTGRTLNVSREENIRLSKLQRFGFLVCALEHTLLCFLFVGLKHR